MKTVAATLIVLSLATTTLAGNLPWCEKTEGPLVPIPDPSTWQPAERAAAAADGVPWYQPPGLQAGDTYQLIFATSFQTTVDSDPLVPPVFPRFGGLDAGDWIVTFAAASSGLPGLPNPWNGEDLVYQAVLSINGSDARDRLAISGPVYNTHGELIALDAGDLWDGSIANPVGFDETGNGITGSPNVWTGSSPVGRPFESCGAWDNATSNVSGTLGDVSVATSQWISGFSQSCDRTARLYGVSPPITAVPEPSTITLAVLFGLGFGWLMRTGGRP